ncbi:ATP-dependent Clp protease adapter protein CLPS2, chloroplastic-like [Macadamia integrifolia]|uniref:ATP-dependent Clp protease adapter protein CLPS2, chloroplastic-like n=1 Tax=Macadamia integrifolia TaxID=60698 RepID=UPI001C5010D2|nr:ATP-dependent Clp protease adapter protein CLPS2, chloroplastic-like [Macadamia integrifolia]
MEMAAAISSRTTGLYPPKMVQFSSSPLNCISSISLPQKKRSGYGMASLSAKSRFGSLKGGAGLLERPNFDQSQFDPTPQAEEGGDIGRRKDKRGTGSGDSYRVLLIDDRRHTEKCVAQVLSYVVPSVTYDDGRKIFHESRQNGASVVTVAVKEHAEYYAHIMVRWGLRSAIEPDSKTM